MAALYTHIALLHFFLLLPISASSGGQRPLQSTPAQAAMREEKFRLGSMPPSCQNRCSNCKPCIAAQVPTLPGPPARLSRFTPADQPPYNQYNSNYKPLGWKCCCGGWVYDP